MLMMPLRVASLGVGLVAMATLAHAQPRVDVPFQVPQTTVVGQSVFVLGDLPELGGGDLRRAVKLEPSAYPTWRGTIALPPGRAFSYQFVIRNDAPGQGGNLANGTAVTGTFAGSTPPPIGPEIPGRLILARTTIPGAILNWRVGSSGSFIAQPLERLGAGRTPAEAFVRARLVPAAAGSALPLEFFLTSATQPARDPASGVYTTTLDAIMLQDGGLFTYIPAASVSAPLRDYNPASPPTIVSANLNNETRRYRVFLPRGYAQHTWKRYPVLYMHDGQNVFETGPFGSWNAATTIAALQRTAQMAEIIVVGIDNGPNRLQDYAAPDSGGWADRYTRFIRDELKPRIDAQYRTIPDASVTGTAGSSMGGQVSLYQGWDFTSTFTRVGAFSGAWNIFSTGFYDRVRAQPKRAIRIYLDSGDSGTANDNYWLTYNLRDNLLARAGDDYVLERDLKHVVGLGQQHNEPAWAARLPGALSFLYPASEEPATLTAWYHWHPRRSREEALPSVIPVGDPR